ncbi:hypothetical protein Dimus_004185 [Dionaea muscipula]
MKCYSIAPTRSISLNLAVRYADFINSIMLQLAVQWHGASFGGLGLPWIGRRPRWLWSGTPLPGSFPSF